MTKKRILLASFCVLGLTLPIHAASGASFLKIGVGARALGMGGAYTAVANDATALYWNPGGLARMERKELSLTHAASFAETSFDFVGYAHPTRVGTFAFSGLHLSQGALDGRDDNRNAAGSFTASDSAATLAFARAVTSKINVGASAKLIRQTIANENAQGVAFDLGLTANTPVKNLTVGAAALNLGPGMKFVQESYSLPLTLSVGTAYRVWQPLALSGDLRHYPVDARTSLSFGMEFSPVQMVALRAGYISAAAASSPSSSEKRASQLEGLTGFGAGMGLQISHYRLDYAFTPAGELGNVQRVSFSMKW